MGSFGAALSNAWERLVEETRPAMLLVTVEGRMGPRLRRQYSPEDILQEALLHAWRDRVSAPMHCPRQFRTWLLAIIENRLRDSARRVNSSKRSGPVPDSGLEHDIPLSATPGRIAAYRERAAIMKAALDRLPDDVREIVRLRLFEQLELAVVSEHVGLSVAVVRHRLRVGSQLYAGLVRELTSGTGPANRGATPEISALEHRR